MPTRVRTAMTRLTALVLLAAALCVAVVSLIWVLEPAGPSVAGGPSGPTIEPPADRDAPPVVDLSDPDLNVELAQGGWVQIAGDDGELAQQYRFDHLDPDPADLPAHWLRMQRPQVQLFMAGGRTVTLAGSTLDAYAPKRALEQGTLEGDVVIQLFEGDDGGRVDTDTASPSMVVHTGMAMFDNLSGRIECPGAITATSATERMSGSDLLVLLNDRDDRVEFLRLAKVDWIMMQERSLQPTAGGMHRGGSVRLASMQDAPSNGADADFYRLRMVTEVRIEQEDQSGRRLALGDTLDVIFSMSSQSGPRPLATVAEAAPSLPLALATMALGASDVPEARPGEIVVTCEGPLTMVPLPDDMSAPNRPEDSRLELRGDPVRLLDTSDRIGGLCARLEYRSDKERVDLLANPGGEVTLITDDVWLRSKGALWAEMDTGLAGSPSTSGSAVMLTSSPLTAALLDEDAARINPDAPAEIQQDLSIEWTDGVSVRFEPGGASGAGQMKFVQFNGDVKIRSADGDIDAQSLEMRFVPDDSGKARPERFLARGDVRAHNEDQTLWSDTLVATLEAADDVESEEDETAQEEDHAQDIMGDARVRDFDAAGDVQVLLADGARAFADTLTGDARQERVVLKGADIVVARADLLIEHGTEVTIERREGKATWPGGGLARLLRRSIDVTQDHRIRRPDLPRPTTEVPRVVSMRATWNDALTYDASFADGAGALDLSGDVAVVSQQKPTERASLGGAELRLEFASIADELTPLSDEAPQRTDGPGPTFSGEGRVLSRLIATGKARLERRTWPTGARAQSPEVVYIGGDALTWDDIRMRALVEGEGDFVTRRPSWAARGGDGPFRGPGTARFTWNRRLDLVREKDDRFHIVMTGMVEGLWKAAHDTADIATLSADAVTAITGRPPDTASSDERPEPRSALDFNSEASIERVTAKGRVFLATPMRRADADALDYSTRTGIARLEGRPGHPVAVVTEGTPLPVRATAMIWNMDPAIDTITLQSPRGAGNR